MSETKLGPLAGIVLIGVCLGGCESFNLRPPAVEDLVAGNSEAEVVASADAIMNKYLQLSSDLSFERNYFNLPLLGGAAGAAGALLFAGGQPQTNILKGIGLGAATLTATQTYLSPGDRMSAYARGADAVACVIDAGGILMAGEPATSQPRSDLDQASTSLQRALDAAKQFDQPGADAVFKDALAAATAARDAVRLELDALNSSVSDTKGALRSIITQVRTVVLTAHTVDFSATRDALVQAATQSANAKMKKDQAGTGNPSPPPAAQQALRGEPTTIGSATQSLRDATGLASKALIHEFAQAKATLTACPGKF